MFDRWDSRQENQTGKAPDWAVRLWSFPCVWKLLTPGLSEPHGYDPAIHLTCDGAVLFCFVFFR